MIKYNFSSSRSRSRFITKITVIVTVMAIVILYSLYQIGTLIFGPKITIISPSDGSLIQEPFLTISGTIKNASSFHVNGRPVLPDMNGNFADKLLLAHGYNIIELSANDRFDRETKKSLQIIYK